MTVSNLWKTNIPDTLEKKKGERKQIGSFYQDFPEYRNLNLV